MEQYQVERIKKLMEAKNVTGQQLAAASGISAMTISRIFTKPKYNPSLPIIESIAQALDVEAQYIIERTVIETERQPKLPINGFVEYGGNIYGVKTFKQLEKLYNDIKNDMNITKLANELRAKDRDNKKSQSKTKIDIAAIDLRRVEEYDTTKVATWSFLHTDDVRNGHSINIGNFSSEHGLDLCGEHFLHSESAYIVGLFSNNTQDHINIQRQLQYEKSPNDAKFKVRSKYVKQGYSRTDWDEFKAEWMLYVVWQKCISNSEFAQLLRYIPQDVIIIENTTNQGAGSSLFWGAQNKEIEDAHDCIEREVELLNPSMAARELNKLKSIERNKINNIGVFKGVNCLGKCFNICKYCLEHNIVPPINYDLLRSKQIYLFGKLLTFDNEPTPLKPKKKAAKVTKESEPSNTAKCKFRTVIFDFDGTLVDTRPLFEYNHLLRGKERMSKEWQQAMKEYLSHMKDCQPFDGIDEVLQYIKVNNIDAYIVTGGNQDKVKEAIKLFGWKGIFKGIVSRYAITQWQKRTKTNKDNGANPILFKKCLYDFDIDASDCVSFGNEEVDTKAARMVGIDARNAYWGAEGDDREAFDTTWKDLNTYNPIDIIDILKSEPKEVILSEDEQLELVSTPSIPNYGIMGAIVGDIQGSMYERKPNKNIPLDKKLIHSSKMQYTDDTVQTLAVAQWLMTDTDHTKEKLIKLMKRYGKTYKFKWSGEWFKKWLESSDNKPNDSQEDGAAMRVSPVAYYAKTLEECLDLAQTTAEVSHNSHEGITGAQASAAAVYMYLHGSSKDEIKEYISNTFGYDLNTTTNDIRPTYKLETLCSKVVPQAIVCFLEGETYEDVIKLAISLGGDADTQAAIAGSIAAAKMPIPQVEAEICYESLPTELKKVVTDFYETIGQHKKEILTH